jgi:hypothetical protein
MSGILLRLERVTLGGSIGGLPVHRLVITALGAALLLACGPSSAEIKRARTAHYSCEYEQVFKAAFDEVQAQQPPIERADPERGFIMTDFRWHDTNGLRKKRGAAVIGEGDVGLAISISIEKRTPGWFLTGEPYVFTHVVGSPRGQEIGRDHGDWPAWADTKVDKLLIGINQRLAGCAVATEAPSGT